MNSCRLLIPSLMEGHRDHLHLSPRCSGVILCNAMVSQPSDYGTMLVAIDTNKGGGRSEKGIEDEGETPCASGIKDPEMWMLSQDRLRQTWQCSLLRGVCARYDDVQRSFPECFRRSHQTELQTSRSREERSMRIYLSSASVGNSHSQPLSAFYLPNFAPLQPLCEPRRLPFLPQQAPKLG